MSPLWVETEKGAWHEEAVSGKVRWVARNFWVEAGEERKMFALRGIPEVVLRGFPKGGEVIYSGEKYRVRKGEGRYFPHLLVIGE